MGFWFTPGRFPHVQQPVVPASRFEKNVCFILGLLRTSPETSVSLRLRGQIPSRFSEKKNKSASRPRASRLYPNGLKSGCSHRSGTKYSITIHREYLELALQGLFAAPKTQQSQKLRNMRSSYPGRFSQPEVFVRSSEPQVKQTFCFL